MFSGVIELFHLNVSYSPTLDLVGANIEGVAFNSMSTVEPNELIRLCLNSISILQYRSIEPVPISDGSTIKSVSSASKLIRLR